MKQTTKSIILASIGNIYEQSKSSSLNAEFFESADADLKLVSEYFGVTPSQALIVAMVFALNYKGDTVDIKDLTEFFECNPLKMLDYSDDFETLYNMGIFKKIKTTHRIKLSLANDQFIINQKITEAILLNRSMPVVEKERINDIIELIEELYKLGKQVDDKEMESFELFRHVSTMLDTNAHFPLVQKINEFEFTTTDTYLLLYLIWLTVNGNEATEVGRIAQGIFSSSSARINFVQDIINGDNRLISENLMEVVEAEFFDDTEVKLTSTALTLIHEHGIKLFGKKKKNKDLIEPESITVKNLIFNEFEQKQLDFLYSTLSDENFIATQERLEKKGLPKGITVLLHGLPGTGKTETVFQLAKTTGRSILKVDISRSKSMWFGESEKIIKRIFTNYTEYTKNCERTPILLFNEADAIISKRRDAGTSNTSQTENAMQNIILEELENFKGIFIATTNLSKNLDTAFERRFLFKIEFNKPNLAIKSQIWHDKLPILLQEECDQLASKYDFSGGQIDNIVRKAEIHEIIHGIGVNFDNLLEFCNTELLAKKHESNLGFSKK